MEIQHFHMDANKELAMAYAKHVKTDFGILMGTAKKWTTYVKLGITPREYVHLAMKTTFFHQVPARVGAMEGKYLQDVLIRMQMGNARLATSDTP